MALVKSLSGNHICGFRLGSVCSLGRKKRVLVRSHSSIDCAVSTAANNHKIDAFGFDFEFGSGFLFDSSLKRQCVADEENSESVLSAGDELEGKSVLEAMPPEIVIKIICGVNHDDLKKLFFVSKSIREAAITAKKCHFAYSTPSKTKAFRNSIDFDDTNQSDDQFEAPDAPKQSRIPRSRLNGKTSSDISVKLFDSDDEQGEQMWIPKYRKSLFFVEY